MTRNSITTICLLAGWQYLSQTDFCYREMRWISDQERCENLRLGIERVTGRDLQPTHTGCKVRRYPNFGSPICHAFYKAIGFGLVQVGVWRPKPDTRYPKDSEEYNRENSAPSGYEFACGAPYYND